MEDYIGLGYYGIYLLGNERVMFSSEIFTDSTPKNEKKKRKKKILLII